MIKRDKKSGSMTVEATLIMPLFIMVMFFVIHFLNISYAQFVIQQGLNNAGNTLAKYGYAIDLFIGLDKFNNNSLDKNFQDVEKSFEEFNNMTDAVGKAFSEFSYDNIVNVLEEGKKFSQTLNNTAKGFKDINGEKIVSYLLTSGSEVGVSKLVESIVEEYLSEMHVSKGYLDGDIKYQVMMNKDYDICLVATYRYKSPFFPDFYDGVNMRQVVVVRPWIGGKTKGLIKGK